MEKTGPTKSKCKLTGLRKTLLSEIFSYLNLYKDYGKVVVLNSKLRGAIIYNLYSFMRKDKYALNFYSKNVTVLDATLHDYYKTKLLKRIQSGRYSQIIGADSMMIKLYVLEMEKAFLSLVKDNIIVESQVPKIKQLIPWATGVLCNHLNTWLVRNSLLSLELNGLEIGFEGAVLIKKLVLRGRLESLEIVNCRIIPIDMHQILQGIIDYVNYLTIDLTGTKLDEKAVSMCSIIKCDVKKTIYLESVGLKKNKKSNNKFKL